MLDIATFSASGLDLNREGILAALELMLTDLRLPPAIGELIRGLVAVDRRDRWDLDRAEKFLLNITPPNDDAPLFNPLGYALHSRAPSRELRLDVADTVAGISRFILSKSRLGRRDSLWPSSPEVFLTNPVNLQYGAAGTAYFLLRSNGFVPDEVLDWIFEVGRRSTCPPGLARGYSGTALLLLEAGRHEQAKAMLELGAGSPILEQESGLYLGSSGWGLVQLHFWHRLGESQYLTSALEIGKQLADSAREMPEGVVWTRQSRHSHGLFDGPSGVALFLIYLAAASGDNSFLDLARRALSFDLANRRESGADLLWYPYLNSPPSEPLSPHLWFGTAGIGAALIRAWAVTGDPELLAWAKRCAATVANRYTNKIWYDFGLSGYGELQLDFYHFLGEQQYLQTAWHLSEAILPHRVSKPEGYVFAGRDFHRLCCDLGWGSAGIGIFLNRLLEPATPRLFMLDDLLSESLRRRDRATVTQAAELAERK